MKAAQDMQSKVTEIQADFGTGCRYVVRLNRTDITLHSDADAEVVTGAKHQTW